MISIVIELSLYFFGKQSELIVYILPIIPLLCIHSYIDFKINELPNLITYTLIIFGLGRCIMNDNFKQNIMIAIVILLVGAMLSFGLGKIGFGDIKVIIGLGLLLNYIPLMNVLIYACIFTIIYICIHNIKIKHIEKETAFGPFIYMGLYVYLMFIGV